MTVLGALGINGNPVNEFGNVGFRHEPSVQPPVVCGTCLCNEDYGRLICRSQDVHQLMPVLMATPTLAYKFIDFANARGRNE
jgi:hypothetical protein